MKIMLLHLLRGWRPLSTRLSTSQKMPASLWGMHRHVRGPGGTLRRDDKHVTAELRLLGGKKRLLRLTHGGKVGRSWPPFSASAAVYGT